MDSERNICDSDKNGECVTHLPENITLDNGRTCILNQVHDVGRESRVGTMHRTESTRCNIQHKLNGSAKPQKHMSHSSFEQCLFRFQCSAVSQIRRRHPVWHHARVSLRRECMLGRRAVTQLFKLASMFVAHSRKNKNNIHRVCASFATHGATAAFELAARMRTHL